MKISQLWQRFKTFLKEAISTMNVLAKLAEKYALSKALKVFTDLIDTVMDAVHQQVSEEGTRVITKLAGKYLPLGGPIFGRYFALFFTLVDKPPEQHPRALYVGKIRLDYFGVTIHLWLTSFSKKKWITIPPTQILKIKF